MTHAKIFTPPAPLQTAVLLVVFNRPATTRLVFEAIRQAKPPRLYIAADGPRRDRPSDIGLCEEVRRITGKVDWPCEVRNLYRDSNLGCGPGVSGGISWFFEHEEEGIILEDDLIPSQSFFWFCQELLERYRYDERIFIISGYNKKNRWRADACDYFYSFLGGINGWATWRRAWKFYDPDMTNLEAMVKENAFVRQMGRRLGELRQRRLIEAKEMMAVGKISAWDYPWGLSRHRNRGLACVSSKNLIQNIGNGPDSTHTAGAYFDHVDLHDLKFPIRAQIHSQPDEEYDLAFLADAGRIKQFLSRIRSACASRGMHSNG